MGIRDEMLASCPTGHTYALGHAACPYCFEVAQRARALARRAEIAAKTERNRLREALSDIANDRLTRSAITARRIARAALAAGKNSWCYTCGEPVAPGCGPEHDVRPPLAAGKEVP